MLHFRFENAKFIMTLVGIVLMHITTRGALLRSAPFIEEQSDSEDHAGARLFYDRRSDFTVDALHGSDSDSDRAENRED